MVLVLAYLVNKLVPLLALEWAFQVNKKEKKKAVNLGHRLEKM